MICVDGLFDRTGHNSVFARTIVVAPSPMEIRNDGEKSSGNSDYGGESEGVSRDDDDESESGSQGCATCDADCPV